MSEQKTEARFPSLSIYANPVEMEKAMIDFWEESGVFEDSQQQRDGQPVFAFYEGPPTANGSPGVHHVITRLAKDSICRYKTMNGYFVRRKAGWDTHGLPVELEVQKTLGLKTKEDIEEYGIGRFNEACRDSVFRYEKEWKKLTQRMGYWLNLDDPYITCTNNYVESVWWLLRQLWDAELIYEGHKVMPYNPRLGTVYSSHEVAQGYQEVEDPSITVRFALEDDEASLLVWTTTPWTLLSNVAAAVHEDLEYLRVRLEDGEELILAASRLLTLGDRSHEIVGRMKGSDLVGRRYRRLFEFAPIPEGKQGAVVIAADFVSDEDGTGIVHLAPAYGQDDYDAGRAENLALIALVGPDGIVAGEAGPFAGLDFKAADKPVIADLRDRGLLFDLAVIKHTYPHCWRDRGPLIYYAQPAWFIRTTALKERFIAANNEVNWFPEEVGRNRFGNWLEGNIDWALSRDRFWGTPLPIWQTEDGKAVCVGSMEELERLAGGSLPDGVDLHKPWVDDLELRHPETGEAMRRVPDVIDAWFDSGSMPFAQWHYPFENKEIFESQFPAEFICEAIDQSRGWFYSLLAISVFMKDKAPFRNVLVSELVLDAEGKKMSKSLGNAVDPFAVLENEGGDALRLYMASASPIWAPLRFEPDGPREMNSKMLGTLRNTYKFFALYANLDGWTPGCASAEPTVLDRWLQSRFETLVAETRLSLDRYDITRAVKGLAHFIQEELSNWYVRRSRRRFWKGEMSGDKAAAYETLYSVLERTCRLLAPFAPFLSEALWRNLSDPDQSVHAQSYPEPLEDVRDSELEEAMEAVLTLVGMGRGLRNRSGMRVRQPLARLCVHGGGAAFDRILADEELLGLVLDELNIKELVGLEEAASIAEIEVKPRFKVLGPRLGSSMKAVAGALAALQPDQAMEAWKLGEVEVEADGRSFRMERDELDFTARALGPYEAGLEQGLLGALKTELDDDLLREGQVREIVNRVQNLRKDSGLEVSDRIRLRWSGGALTEAAMNQWHDHLASEVLADEISQGLRDSDSAASFELGGEEVSLVLEKA